MRFLATISVGFFFCSSHVFAQHRHHPDDHVNYKTCDRTKWQARWEGNNFRHKRDGQGAGHNDTIINYLTWDGTCWQASWDSNEKRFAHKNLKTGAIHKDEIMNYITWDDTKWTAIRRGNGFYHFFTSDKDCK